MAILKLNSQIVDSETKVFMAWDGREGISFEDVKTFIADIPEDDKDIDIHINCAGGNCVEGWAIYDALRQSAKNITAVIEGQCSSMASVILLAAPKENRKAYANAHLCIHNPEACYLDIDYYSRLTADNIDAMTEKMKNQAESLRAEQQKILELYIERTGTDAETLQDLMNQDIFINMDRAKELGFVSETLVPNTASRTKINIFNMANKNEQSAAAKAFRALGVALGIIADEEEKKMQSLTISTPAGDELVIEREEGNPQVGDAASPDGTFVLDDGTTIVVENGVISSITKEEEEVEEEDKKTQALTDPATGNEISEEEAQNLLNEQAARIAELEEKLKESEEEAQSEKEKNEALTASQMTDEQKEILSIVDQKGGKEWLDLASKMRSYGFHKKTNQQDLNDPNKQPEEKKIGAGFLARHTEGYKKID